MSEETERLDALQKELDAGTAIVEYLLATVDQIIATQTALRLAIHRRRMEMIDGRIQEHVTQIQEKAKRGRPRGSYALKPLG